MPFFSISCVRIETAAATAAGSCLRCCCCLRFCCCLRCCYSGGGCAEFLSGIIARARATTWLPDPPLRHGALPFVCFAAFLWLLCQLFLLHQQQEPEQAQRLRVFLCPGNAIRIVCLGSFSPCQAGGWAAERHIDYAFDWEAVASRGWGWGWAWGECKSTAIVARVCARK